MKKTCIKKVVFLLSIFGIFSACVTTNIGGKPLWVDQPDAVYPKIAYLSFIGTGNNRKESEGAAKANALQFIRQEIAIKTTTGHNVSENNGKYSSAYEYDAQVKTASTLDNIVGLNIASYWTDGQTHFSLAQLDRAKTKFYYEGKINENNAIITKQYLFAKNNPATLEGYFSLKKAEIIAQHTQDFYDIVNAVQADPLYNSVENQYTPQSLAIEADKFAQTCLIEIRVSGTDNKRIKTAITSALAQAGFKTITEKPTNGSDAPYLMDTKITFTELPSDGKTYFVRYEVVAELKDARNNKVIFPFADNGREGHVSYYEAQQRALRTIEQNFVTKFFGEFTKSILVE